PNAMRHGVKVFAWQPIEEGEEITIDYRLNAFDDSCWPCECRSESCTGTVVGSFFAMNPERQELLVRHAPGFIRRGYRRRARNRGCHPPPVRRTTGGATSPWAGVANAVLVPSCRRRASGSSRRVASPGRTRSPRRET